MKESDFPTGTRFFLDDGDPVSISPSPEGAVITNWFAGRPAVVPATEFARNSPPSAIGFEEFAKRVAREKEAQAAS